MNKQDIYDLLTQKNIPHEITENGAVYNMSEVAMTELLMDIMGVHPKDNSATVWMKPEDLVELIKEHGNAVDWIEV